MFDKLYCTLLISISGIVKFLGANAPAPKLCGVPYPCLDKGQGNRPTRRHMKKSWAESPDRSGWTDTKAPAAKVGSRRILLKNNVLRAQKSCAWRRRKRLS